MPANTHISPRLKDNVLSLSSETRQRKGGTSFLHQHPLLILGLCCLTLSLLFLWVLNTRENYLRDFYAERIKTLEKENGVLRAQNPAKKPELKKSFSTKKDRD